MSFPVRVREFRTLGAVGLIALGGAAAASCSAKGDSGAGAQGPIGPEDSGAPVCGNEVVEGNEECDDGNYEGLGGCKSDCTFTCILGATESRCSDFLPCNGVETCEDGHVCMPGTPLVDFTSCGVNRVCKSGRCELAEVRCGDAIVVEPAEECEDGNTASGDGCFGCKWECSDTDPSRRCQSQIDCVGDGTCNIETHTCSPGSRTADGTACRLDPSKPAGQDNSGVCRAGSCATIECGNGAQDPGEECDDGNSFDADGCNNDCRVSCIASDPSRDCATGDVCKGTSTCNSAHQCSVPTPMQEGDDCGSSDGITKYCDLQNGSLVCTVAECGNGRTEPNEECDDGPNTDDNDGCRNNCTFTCETAAECGDAKQCTRDECNLSTHTCVYAPDSAEEGENCSEGGVTTGRCSSGLCTPVRCGDGFKDAAEDCDLGAQNGTGQGCTSNCRYECISSVECDDLDPCSGDGERCVITSGGGKRCTNLPDLSDGTVCQSTPRKICLNSKCQSSKCGDGYVDPGRGEQCEPPDTRTCNRDCKRK